MRHIVTARENSDELFHFKDSGTRGALSNALTCRRSQRDSWNVLKQDSENVTVRDKDTFLVSVILVFLHVRVFNYVPRLVEREQPRLPWQEKHSSR